MEHITSVILFAIAASITPGPNTILALSSGLNFGARKSLPLIFGISVGFTLMLAVIGTGFGQVFEKYPSISVYLKVIGSIYLCYLAILIARGNNQQNSHSRKPISMTKAALLQWVNIKAWIICLSAVATFTSANGSYSKQVMVLTLAFLSVGPMCVGSWVIVGAYLKKQIVNELYIKTLNLTMASLLFLSIAPVLKELLKELT